MAGAWLGGDSVAVNFGAAAGVGEVDELLQAPATTVKPASISVAMRRRDMGESSGVSVEFANQIETERERLRCAASRDLRERRPKGVGEIELEQVPTGALLDREAV